MKPDYYKERNKVTAYVIQQKLLRIIKPKFGYGDYEDIENEVLKLGRKKLELYYERALEYGAFSIITKYGSRFNLDRAVVKGVEENLEL